MRFFKCFFCKHVIDNTKYLRNKDCLKWITQTITFVSFQFAIFKV